MKAITILEPWASLIACGAKRYETRGWPTKYRGEIAIHAAKQFGQQQKGLIDKEPFHSSLFKVLDEYSCNTFLGRVSNGETFGKVIAIADLVDCYYIVYHPGTNIDIAKNINIGAESMANDKHHPDFGKYIVPSSQEIAFGDWTPRRYAWALENVQRIAPVPARGQQRIWNWDGME